MATQPSPKRWHDVQVEVTGPCTNKVLLDGLDITKGCADVKLFVDDYGITKVQLELYLSEPSRWHGNRAEVALPAHTVRALMRLGWRPPPPTELTAYSYGVPVMPEMTEVSEPPPRECPACLHDDGDHWDTCPLRGTDPTEPTRYSGHIPVPQEMAEGSEPWMLDRR